jgi:hypothetical protein
VSQVKLILTREGGSCRGDKSFDPRKPSHHSIPPAESSIENTKQLRLKSKTKMLVSISLLVLFVGLEKGRLVFGYCVISIRTHSLTREEASASILSKMFLTMEFKMHGTEENIHQWMRGWPNYIL